MKNREKIDELIEGDGKDIERSKKEAKTSLAFFGTGTAISAAAIGAGWMMHNDIVTAYSSVITTAGFALGSKYAVDLLKLHLKGLKRK